MVAWQSIPMDQTGYWHDRISVAFGPDWDERIMIRNEDGIGRPATSSELREAAQYLDWLRPYLRDGAEAG
jgi:hypothetical protein